MTRSTARWTTALAATALLAMPASGLAQTAPQTPPASARPEQPATPQDHLRKAEKALKGIEMSSVAGETKARIDDLKQRLSKLERAEGRDAAAATPPAQAEAAVRWETEVAAIDRTLNELLGAGSTGAVGTTGTTASADLNAEVRSKLTEFRTHITAFAAAMGGKSEPGAAATGTAGTMAQPPTSTEPPSPTQPTPPAQPPMSTQPPAATGTEPSAPAQAGKTDPQGAKQHLSAARDTLSEITQLPAAAQLTGDARTQVSELISNFNELITTNVDWRASYGKVDRNLDALLGPEAPPDPARTGTEGAVGTSGAIELDPAVRAKLVEFRSHLDKFEEAAGGAKIEAGAAASGAMTGASASTGATQTSTGQAQPPTSATQPPAGQAQAAGQMDHQELRRHIEAIEAILQSAGTAGAAGTSSTAGTAGTTGTTQAGITLTAAQTEQLRSHLNELKRLIDQR